MSGFRFIKMSDFTRCRFHQMSDFTRFQISTDPIATKTKCSRSRLKFKYIPRFLVPTSCPHHAANVLSSCVSSVPPLLINLSLLIPASCKFFMCHLAEELSADWPNIGSLVTSENCYFWLHHLFAFFLHSHCTSVMQILPASLKLSVNWAHAYFV